MGRCFEGSPSSKKAVKLQRIVIIYSSNNTTLLQSFIVADVKLQKIRP
jgi:hypothetical protein